MEVLRSNTKNYSPINCYGPLGLKGALSAQSVQWDLTLFHIDWRDIQLTQYTTTGLAFPINGGTATSNGFEISATYSPMREWQIALAAGHTDAYLTENTPPGNGGLEGDALPGSPRWTGSVTTDYRHPIRANTSVLMGGSYRYKDAVVNQFEHTGEPLPIGPQDIVNLYGGLAIRTLTVRLFATNVFNSKSYAGLPYIADPTRPAFVPVQPRTIGLSVDYLFSK